MKKKLSFSIIFIICAALVLFGLNAFAFGSSGSSSSTVINGTLTKVDAQKSTITVQTADGEKTVPIAASVWVFRNDQKAALSDVNAGDKVELVMNSKNQAAYIKAFAPSGAAAEPTPTPTSTPSPTPASTSTPTPVPTSTPVPSVSPSPTKTASPASGKAAVPGTDGVRLQVNGPHFSLELKQGEGSANKNYELYVKSGDGGAVRLKGDEAAKWIRALLGSVNLNSADAQQQLLLLISQQYGIDSSKLQVNMDVKPQQQNNEQKDDNNQQHGNSYNPAAPVGNQVNQQYDRNGNNNDNNHNSSNSSRQQYGNNEDNHGEKAKGKQGKDD